MEQAKRSKQPNQAISTSKSKPSNNTSKTMHPKYKKFKQRRKIYIKKSIKKTNKRIARTPFNFKYQYQREERTYERFNEFVEDNESKAIRDKHLVKGDNKQSDSQKLVEATTTKLGKAYNELGGFKKLG